MIGKWYNWSTNTQNQWRVDLTMGISFRISFRRIDSCLYKILEQNLQQLNLWNCLIFSQETRWVHSMILDFHQSKLFTHTDGHRNHCCLLFFRVNIFYKALCYKIMPTTIIWAFLKEENQWIYRKEINLCTRRYSRSQVAHPLLQCNNIFLFY